MTKARLQSSLGLFIVGAHLGLVIVIITLFFVGGLSFDELTTTVGLISPMLAIYTSAIIRYFIATQAEVVDTSPRVGKYFVYIVWALPIIFVSLLTVMVFLKAYNIGFSSFEQFKIAVAMLEGVFGVYVGQVLGSLYDLHRAK